MRSRRHVRRACTCESGHERYAPPGTAISRMAHGSAAPSVYAKKLRAWQRVIRAGLRVRRLPASLQPLAALSKAFPPPCLHGHLRLAPLECVVGSPDAARVAVLDGPIRMQR